MFTYQDKRHHVVTIAEHLVDCIAGGTVPESTTTEGLLEQAGVILMTVEHVIVAKRRHKPVLRRCGDKERRPQRHETVFWLWSPPTRSQADVKAILLE